MRPKDFVRLSGTREDHLVTSAVSSYCFQASRPSGQIFLYIGNPATSVRAADLGDVLIGLLLSGPDHSFLKIGKRKDSYFRDAAVFCTMLGHDGSRYFWKEVGGFRPFDRGQSVATSK